MNTPLIVFYHIGKTGGTNMRTRLSQYYNDKDVGLITGAADPKYDVYKNIHRFFDAGKFYSFVSGHIGSAKHIENEYFKNYIKIATFRDPYEFLRSTYFHHANSPKNENPIFKFGPKNYLDSAKNYPYTWYEHIYLQQVQNLDIFDYWVEVPSIEYFVSYLEKKLNLIKKTEISLVELNKNKHPDKKNILMNIKIIYMRT